MKEGFEIIRSSIVKIVIISTTSSKAYWSNNESFSSIKNFDFVFLFNTYIVCENKLITKHNLKKKTSWVNTVFTVDSYNFSSSIFLSHLVFQSFWCTRFIYFLLPPATEPFLSVRPLTSCAWRDASPVAVVGLKVAEFIYGYLVRLNLCSHNFLYGGYAVGRIGCSLWK